MSPRTKDLCTNYKVKSPELKKIVVLPLKILKLFFDKVFVIGVYKQRQ